MRCIVRCVRLKLSGAQRLLKRLLLVHQFVDRIGLIAVCHDCLVAKHTDRCINDEARICQLGRIKCLCADSFAILHKNPVTAVLASSHDKVSGYRIFSIPGSANHNSSSRICIGRKFLRK